jgi:hypothetical protein
LSPSQTSPGIWTEGKKKPIPESVLRLVAGLSILCASLLAMLLVLPSVTPYEFLSCQVSRGAQECFGNPNPVYPLAFIIYVAGTLLLFLGLFGRSFIFRPLFVFGIFVLEIGLLPVVFGFLGTESCASQSGRFFGSSCTAYNPGGFYPFIALGALSIGLQTYRHLRLR